MKKHFQKFLLITVLLVIKQPSFSQSNIVFTEGPEQTKDVSAVMDIVRGIAKTGDSMMFIQRFGALSNIGGLGISFYDKNLKELSLKRIEIKVKKDKINSFYINSLNNNELFAFYFDKNTFGNCDIYASSIDKNTLSPNDDVKKVMSFPYTDDYRYLDLLDNSFKIMVSPDKSKFAIAMFYKSAGKKSVKVAVLDSQINILDEYDIPIDSKIKAHRLGLENCTLSNNGNFMIVGVEYDYNSHDSYLSPENDLVVFYGANGKGSYTFYQIPGKNQGYGNAKIFQLNNGNFAIFSFTLNQSYADGYQYFEFNPETGEKINDTKHVFTFDEIKQYCTKSQLKKFEKNYSSGKPIGFKKETIVRDYYIDAENNIWIISEEIDYRDPRVIDLTALNVLKINANSKKLEWSVTVPKYVYSYWGAREGGLLTLKGDNCIDIVYSDQKKNFPIVNRAEHDIDWFGSEYQTVTLHVDAKGKVNKKLLLDDSPKKDAFFVHPFTYIPTGSKEGVCIFRTCRGFEMNTGMKLGYFKF